MAKITLQCEKKLIEEVYSYDVVIVGTGIHNTLGNGFQYDVKINFPTVEEVVKAGKYADPRKLGTVSVVNLTPVFCVAYIHKGSYRKDLKPEYLDYDALELCLKLINENFEGKRIATTLIGCGEFDGNGDRERVLDMFRSLPGDNEYFIYDYEQKDYREVNNAEWRTIIDQVGKIPYEELRKLKDEYIHRRKYGIYNNTEKEK